MSAHGAERRFAEVQYDIEGIPDLTAPPCSTFMSLRPIARD